MAPLRKARLSILLVVAASTLLVGIAVSQNNNSHNPCPSPKPDSSAFSTTSLVFLPTKNYEIKI